MAEREYADPGARDHLRAVLSERRERLMNFLRRGALPFGLSDDIVEEVDHLDSALARLDAPGASACARCGEPISLTRRTLVPDTGLCTACALVAEGLAPGRDRRDGPSSTWDAEFLPEIG